MILRTLCLTAFTAFFLRLVGQEGQRFIPAVVAFYNIENLYDTIDSPDTDDAEFLPGGPKLWGTARYERKVWKTAKVLAELGKDLHPDGAHIIGLAEVENRGVLEDLVRSAPIADRGYRIVHEDSPDRRGVDVALLYDPRHFKPYAHRSYPLRVVDKPDFRTRDQLLVSGVLGGRDTVHVIVAHWPSRRGGEKRSQPLRMAAARLGRHMIDSLMAITPHAKVLYMGDLNDDPVDKSVKGGLMSTGERKDAKGRMLFNPMLPLYNKGVGSLAWRDSWNLFDQIILTPALVHRDDDGFRYHGVRVYNEPYLRQQEGNFMGYPFRTFVGDTYADGWSDHFPVFVILTRPAPAAGTP